MRRFEESATLEYKRELSDTFEKDVVSFLNSREGGIVFLGIDAERQLVTRILRKYDASVFHLSDNFTRIVFPYETGYSESSEVSPSSTPQVIADEGVSDGVSEGVKKVFVFIRNNPLCRVPRIAKGTGIPVKTVERYIRKLKAEGKIEFTGAPKTGGYRLIAGEE
jgi:predicted HTH transcriptional regulator